VKDGQSRQNGDGKKRHVLSSDSSERVFEKLLARQAEDFEKDGGFSERLYKARMKNRQNGPNSGRR